MSKVQVGGVVSVAMAFFLMACDQEKSPAPTKAALENVLSELSTLKAGVRDAGRRQDAMERHVREMERRLAALAGIQLSFESMVRAHGREIRIVSRKLGTQSEDFRQLGEAYRRQVERLDDLRFEMRSGLKAVKKYLSHCKVGRGRHAPERGGSWIGETPPRWYVSEHRVLEERIEDLGRLALGLERKIAEKQAVMEAKLSLLSAELRRLRRVLNPSSNHAK